MREVRSIKEIAKALGVPERTIYGRAQRESWTVAYRRPGRGGGKLYAFDELPTDVRTALAAWEAERLRASEIAGGDGRSTLPMVLPPAGERLAQLAPGARPPEKFRQAGLDRYAIVHAWREQVRTAGWGEKGAATETFLLAYRTGAVLPGVAGRMPEIKSPQTLYRWDKWLRDNNDDYLCLCDQEGKWRDGQTSKKGQIGRECEILFLRCWLHPDRPSAAMAYRACSHILQSQGCTDIPSYHSFNRFLKRFDKQYHHITLLAREGEKALKDGAIAYITRDVVPEVGDCCVADGHNLNFLIKHPITGKPARLKLIMFYDWKSRYPVGWQIMPTEDTVGVKAALRHAIQTYGKLPKSVLLDNGKAFKAKVFTETAPDLREELGLYAQLGIAPHFAAPYNARAKVIERFFHTFSEQFERLMPSYTGGSIDDKPAWMLRNEKFHQAWQRARTEGWVPNIREANHLIGLFVDWYARQPHDGLAGRTPWEVFEAERGPGVDVRELDALFLWSKRVTPRNCRVTLFSIEYESDALLGMNQPLIARYATSDLSEIELYTEQGVPVGVARPVKALSPLAKLFGDAVGLMEVKDALKKQRRQIKATKAGLREIFGAGRGGGSQLGDELANGLPWLRKEDIILPAAENAVGVPQQPTLPEVSHAPGEKDASRAAREAAFNAALKRADEEERARLAAPALVRPKYWQSDQTHYEWLFRAKFEHDMNLDSEDAAFMAEYELGREYARDRGYYMGRLEVFKMKKKAA